MSSMSIASHSETLALMQKKMQDTSAQVNQEIFRPITQPVATNSSAGVGSSSAANDNILNGAYSAENAGLVINDIA